MKGKELHQETDQYESAQRVLSPQQQKVALIDKNTKYFRELLFTSIKIGSLRLIIFFIIIIFEEQFIITQPPKGYAQSWNIMFYVLAAMMDFLGLLNDVQIFKHLQKDQEILRQIKDNLASKTEIRTQTQIGSYTYYLSIYDILKKYKYRSKSSISISETIRFLHVLITICIFGNLAINWQNSVEGQIFKVVFLWVFMLSIYLNVFELDFFVLQNSSGPFIEKRTNFKELANRQQLSQSIQSSIIKTRYIKSCRRPFQIFYLINILSILAIMVVFFKLSLLNLMLTLCICAHMLQLVYEKHIQNNLIDLNIQRLPFVHISPYKIISQLTKSHRSLFKFVTILTRVSIVLSIFAYFKEQQTTTIQNFCFIALFVLLIVSQCVKFQRLDSAKLYILKSKIPQTHQGVECSICLLLIEPNQKQYQLPCFSKHLFHEKCMRNWFSSRKECPLCRYSLQIYQIK